ncbi:MAG: hypothetical protein OXT67_13890 [Zetaproteobacteria bacterium]|nr:hypothetical protein [Zetaproteobacteria bacterium]
MTASPYGSLCQTIERLRSAVTALNYTPTSHQLEKWAMIILEGMSGPSRFYHSPEHVLELSDHMDPLNTIAALFHDIVYYQVDGGLLSYIHAQIHPYYNSVNGILFVREQNEQDFIYETALAIFDYAPGQQLLPSRGQNEFLSAIFAVKQMENVLSKAELVSICASIEATIPFRGGTDAFTQLEARIQKFNIDQTLGISQEEIAKIMQRAVTISNRDVANFAFEDPADFLAQTWRLLPETNARLSASNMYTIREYRIALYKMEGFLSNIRPEMIYQQYKGTPSTEHYQGLIARCRSNLSIASVYMKSKVYAMGVLEALADLTGGDIPLIFMVGDFRVSEVSSKLSRIESHLGKSKFFENVTACVEQNSVVANLLETGRRETSFYSSKSSPLGHYFYQYLGEEEVIRQCDLAKQMFLGKIKSDEFLKQQNPKLVLDVATACSKIAYTRKSRLLSLVKLYPEYDHESEK